MPLATPVVAHAGRLFMIGDGAAPNHVYESLDGTNGRTWHRAAAELPGPPRSAEYSVVFQEAFWVYGGKTGGLGGTGFWDGIAYLR